MDFYNENELRRFLEMSTEEREEEVNNWLAEVAEPWQGDSANDQMARSMVAAMNAYCQVMFNVDEDEIKKSNRHILGLWLHGFVQMARNFQTLAAMTQIKKDFES